MVNKILFLFFPLQIYPNISKLDMKEKVPSVG